MIKYTIITICLNMEEEIGNTITSVLNQTCTDYEYLIKDGLSQDRTVDIAESFAPAFAEKDIPFRIISGPDSGIYDAMNRAVREAQGEWVIFMNAGDRFADKTVLEKVDKSGCLEEADIVYGDRILQNQKWFCYQKAYPLEKIRFGLPFCHQSTFTRKELFDHNVYSLKYRICSAFHFYLQLYREGKKFVYFPAAISIFDTNGVSSNWKQNYQDKIQILEDMPVRDEEAIQRLKETLSQKYRQEFMHQHLWKYVPEKLRMKRRERMRKKAGWKTEEEFFGAKKENP
ncbi:MAG: glycosyltransferase family 2 protein [Anaerovoracaceae bacterium]